MMENRDVSRGVVLANTAVILVKGNVKPPPLEAVLNLPVAADRVQKTSGPGWETGDVGAGLTGGLVAGAVFTHDLNNTTQGGPVILATDVVEKERIIDGTALADFNTSMPLVDRTRMVMGHLLILNFLSALE
jgi:hypothetical protein